MNRTVRMLGAMLFCAGVAALVLWALAVPVADPDAARAAAWHQRLDRLEWRDSTELAALPPEDTCTREELVRRLDEAGFSREEQQALLGEPPADPDGRLRYALIGMDSFTYRGRYILQPRLCMGLEYAPGADRPTRILSVGRPAVYGDGCYLLGDSVSALSSGREVYYQFNGTLCRARRAWVLGGWLTVQAGGGAVTSVSDAGTLFVPELER